MKVTLATTNEVHPVGSVLAKVKIPRTGTHSGTEEDLDAVLVVVKTDEGQQHGGASHGDLAVARSDLTH